MFTGLEGKIIRDGWREYFAPRVAAARADTWGLQEDQKRILGVLVMLDEAERGREEALTLFHDAEDTITTLRGELQALKMRYAKLSKKQEAE